MRTVIRQPGIIPTLSRKMNARRWLFFDTETSTQFKNAYQKRLNFRLGYAVYVEFDADYNLKEMQEHEIRKPQDFVDILDLHLCGSGILRAAAHNLQFDLQILNLPQLLVQAGYTTDLPILAYAACMWTARRDKKTVRFMDSQNIFPGKLERIGQEIGLKKLKVDHSKVTNKALMEYCKNDCHILRVAFTRYLHWLHDNQLGYFGETVSWQAFNAFRTRFMSTAIHIHVDYVVLDYERKAYHGARTECFYIGQAPEQEYFLLDVNSMYAHVMAENEFPVEFERIVIRPTVAELGQLTEEFYVIANCAIETEENVFPVRTATKLVFPRGSFNGWLHDAEVRFGLASGSIRRCRFAIAYRRDFIFEDYVNFFSALKERGRLAGDKSGERLAKQFLLALYGKWGQRQPLTLDQGASNYVGVKSFPAKARGSNLVWDEIHWFGKVYQVVKSFEKPYSCPSIAGAITAYGRMYLWRLMNEAGIENVFYCDTDSLLVNLHGYNNLSGRLAETAIGGLKLVERSRQLALFAPKDYVLGAQSKRKGTSVREENRGQSDAKQEQFRSMSYRLKSGDLSGVDVYEVTKHRISTYDKGRMLSDGRVVPWRLPDDENQGVFGP